VDFSILSLDTGGMEIIAAALDTGGMEIIAAVVTLDNFIQLSVHLVTSPVIFDSKDKRPCSR